MNWRDFWGPLWTACPYASLQVQIAIILLRLGETAPRPHSYGAVTLPTIYQSINSPMDWGGFAYDSRCRCAFP